MVGNPNILPMQRTIVIAGQGIRLANAIAEFKQWIEANMFPFATTKLAIDILPGHPLNRGMVGVRGNYKIPDNTEVVIAIGTSLSVMTVGYKRELLPENANIQIIDYLKEYLNV